MRAPEKFDSSIDNQSQSNNQKKAWVIAAAAVFIAGALCVAFWFSRANNTATNSPASSTKDEDKGSSQTVAVRPDEPKIDVVTANTRAPAESIRVTASVEPNQQQLQQISSLASGRVDEVSVALGDFVRRGQVLIKIDSPQVAEMHGNLHEAETKLHLSRATLDRVKEAANRVSILKAKATLDEARATLKRTKQLVSEGLTAGKDLVAAQSEFDRATAEYNFQKDISLNREVAEALTQVKTSETEVEHIRDSLRALDAQIPKEGEGSEHQISELLLRAPIAGTVIERLVNPGAGVEPGKPLLTIADTSTLWVIANVPENAMSNIQLGMAARVLVNGQSIAGRVSYIDPRLNEDTRTSPVRIVIANESHRISTGSFAQVDFNASAQKSSAIWVPSAAVQTVNGDEVVFVQNAQGNFQLRRVTAGDETSGLVPIHSGLTGGEQIAANGAFVLKSRLLKDQLGDSD